VTFDFRSLRHPSTASAMSDSNQAYIRRVYSNGVPNIVKLLNADVAHAPGVPHRHSCRCLIGSLH
jgi:hypothetical protein